MTAVDTRSVTDVVVLEQLDFEPQCESRVHDTSPIHSGAATHLQLGNCPHSTGLRCAPYVAEAKAGRTRTCEICFSPPIHGYIPTFIPIGDHS